MTKQDQKFLKSLARRDRIIRFRTEKGAAAAAAVTKREHARLLAIAAAEGLSLSAALRTYMPERLPSRP